jgi:hypothetical protein
MTTPPGLTLGSAGWLSVAHARLNAPYDAPHLLVQLCVTKSSSGHEGWTRATALLERGGGKGVRAGSGRASCGDREGAALGAGQPPGAGPASRVVGDPRVAAPCSPVPLRAITRPRHDTLRHSRPRSALLVRA